MGGVSAAASLVTLIQVAVQSCRFVLGRYEAIAAAPDEIRTQCIEIKALLSTMDRLAKAWTGLPVEITVDRQLRDTLDHFLDEARDAERVASSLRWLAFSHLTHTLKDRRLTRFHERIGYWNAVFYGPSCYTSSMDMWSSGSARANMPNTQSIYRLGAMRSPPLRIFGDSQSQSSHVHVSPVLSEAMPIVGEDLFTYIMAQIPYCRVNKAAKTKQVATRHQKVDIVRLLLRLRANVNAADDLGVTPLHLSIRLSDTTDLSKALLASGADLAQRTPLHYYFSSKTRALLLDASLCDSGDLDSLVGCDDQGMTFLHYLVWTRSSTSYDLSALAQRQLIIPTALWTQCDAAGRSLLSALSQPRPGRLHSAALRENIHLEEVIRVRVTLKGLLRSLSPNYRMAPRPQQVSAFHVDSVCRF
ncbi:hypothetical protein CIB48_g8858 [Xylaria polymorpha]|nr:hypothetical protein CIB48_g8858 [Xylaria polymorpha]